MKFKNGLGRIYIGNISWQKRLQFCAAITPTLHTLVTLGGLPPIEMNPACVMSPKGAKASKGGPIAPQNRKRFCQKISPM